MRRAVLQRELALGVAAGGADQLQAERLGPLAGDQADTARGGVEQDEVARLQPVLAGSVRFSRYCTVRPLSIIAAPVSKSIASGSLHDVPRRHHARVAVAPGGLLA